ncbi:hypothetical protein [Sphingomonas sp. RS2018]
MPSASKSSSVALFGQAMLVGATIMAAAIAPPARGRMLVVPMWTAGEGDAVRIALGNGALLLDRGPIARSIVVDGDRTRLAGPLVAAGMALTSAPSGGCGRQEARA